MFRFQFDFEEDEPTLTAVDSALSQQHLGHETTVLRPTAAPFAEIDLDSLIDALPSRLSYSFVTVPSLDTCGTPGPKIARRDLFDARFQLISEANTDDSASALQFIDNPSDLVPLVYEGGLKTWECSLDLAGCLRRDNIDARGRRLLELGCGTAIPTLCLLQDIFASAPANDTETHMHLQDYNASVLQLVTVPNVILAWYTSSAGMTYRNSQVHAPADNDDDDHNDNDSDSELHITPELLAAFRASLCDHGIRLRFFSGSWDTFDPRGTGGPYQLVLTSETIYHPASLPGLVRALRRACGGSDDSCAGPAGKTMKTTTTPYGCLVAAKTVYFGVGGGIAEFVRCVKSSTLDDEREVVGGGGGGGGGGTCSGASGQVETIWEKSTGVSRKIMRVWWAHNYRT